MKFGSLTLKKKIAILITSVVFVIGVAAWLILYRTERNDSIEYTQTMLSRYLDLMALSGEKGGAEEVRELSDIWTALYPDGRVTVVSITGDVLLDTKADPSRMENHYTRGEVMAAFADGEGSEMRYSKTQREWQIYMAKRVTLPDASEKAFVVRLSYPVAKLSGLIKNVTLPFIKYFSLLLIFVWLGTYLLLRLIMKPLNSLSRAASLIARGEPARFPITDDGEIQELSKTLNYMRDSLQKSILEARERKEELAQLVGALPIGVILIDDDRKIRYINQAAGAIICGSAELPARGSSVELILPSRELYQMLDEEDAKKTLSIMRGGTAAMLVEATTLILPRGRLIVLQDLTEKLRLEELRRDFFIDAGHEFQTPLTIIRTGLELLKGSPAMKAPGSAEEAETIESLLRQQERISGLVDDLLLLVRLDSAPAARATEKISLAELARDIAEELSALPRGEDIEIEISAPEEAAVSGIYGDLRRALFNLMENAQKYIQSENKSGGKIKVSVVKAGESWKIIVDDNGPGVPEEERKLIFERFRRGDSHRARRKKSGGYGLGLSISRRVAERHGGSLELGDSELGGAAFVISLPECSGSR